MLMAGSYGFFAGAALAAAAAYVLWLREEPPGIEIAATDGHFRYEGRWHRIDDVKMADWPCTAVHFNVEVAAGGGSLTLVYRAPRTRMSLTVIDAHGSWESRDVFGAWLPAVQQHAVTLRGGNYTITMRKLSSPRPYGNGWGQWLEPSLLEFYGLRGVSASWQLGPAPARRRRIEFIGDGATLGECVDGTPGLGWAAATAFAWQQQSCAAAFPGHLATELSADLDVQALSGIGVMQNANQHVYQFLVGKETMLSYWWRRLQSNDADGTSQRRPDLVVVSLGSSDFMQLGGQRPQNVTFRTMYNKLLHDVVSFYGGFLSGLRIAVFCGPGSSDKESAFFLGRCLACPHVQEAVDYFNRTLDLHTDASTIRVEYFELPCDGTALQADDGFGCQGYPSRTGHRRLAEFLLPRLRTLSA